VLLCEHDGIQKKTATRGPQFDAGPPNVNRKC